MTRIDGKALSESIKEDLKKEIASLDDKPGLAVVLVGTRADSSTYVRMKKQAAEYVGMNFVLKEFPSTISQEDLLNEVKNLNSSNDIHGLIVQLPLPSHIHEETILNAVSLEKDIDGFHPLNMGLLCMKDRNPYFTPCTPKGCMTILKKMDVELRGKHVVVIGRSNIVGIPIAMLCLHENATVTICHSRTKDIQTEVMKGDIVVAAIGRANYVKKEWIKDGAIVIDIGINSVADETRKSGFRLVGDVDYENAKKVASMITPVPGGVGPMTVVSLLENTLESYKRKKIE